MMLSKVIRYGGGGFLVLSALAAMYGVISAQADAPDSIDMQHATEASEAQRQQARGVLSSFLDSCPHVEGVFKHRISEPDVELISPMPYRADRYGWPWEVHISFVVDEDGGIASGHTLDYYAWDDGWVVQKSEGAEFCDKPPEHMKDTYVAFDDH
ncbi:hypothetical protein [Halomonas salina]|uniref:Lipoprotein n=1 Tax=Halomonas salina TaxID=42565 RepID=A0ABR4WTF6_9GAMM|nr:hypothetical protein [Halomonas salina]KGE77645.1 hypothetical protein FP66_08425 [Halomonas salina]